MKFPWTHLISSLREQGVTEKKINFPNLDDPTHLAYLRYMLKETRQEQDLEIPLTHLKVIVFDFETTGFHPQRGDEIISVGGVRFTGIEEEEEYFYSLVKPVKEIPRHIQDLTGIDTDAVATAPSIQVVMRRFMQFVGNRILVAHYAHHDKRFLDETMWKLYRIKSQHRLFDTKLIFQFLHPDWNDYSLESILSYYQIQIGQRHHALSDAQMAAHIWKIAIRELMERGAVHLGDLYHLLAIIQRS